MAKPLIIFGAGASHDYSKLGQPLAPLTKNLVDDQYLNVELLDKYKGAGDLLTDIVYQVRENKKSFEDALTQVQARSSGAPHIKRQFTALEFYLKYLFQRISDPGYGHNVMHPDTIRRMHSMNNYRAMISRINSHSEGKAQIITFNYDTLFERSLPTEQQPRQMSDYHSGDIKITKLHGSHDWSFLRRISDYDEPDVFTWCMKEPDLLNSIKSKGEPYHVNEIGGFGERSSFHQFPALAIPLIGKDRYIAPKNHISSMEKGLRDIDRILIIGWKAKDPMLLETLKNHLPPMRCKVLVVSSTLDSAQEIAATFRKATETITGLVEARGGGFSGFISDEISHTFFAN